MAMSIEEFQPPGENIFCQQCKVIVDSGKSTETDVTEPEGAVIVSGLRCDWGVGKLCKKEGGEVKRRRKGGRGRVDGEEHMQGRVERGRLKGDWQ